MTREAFTTGQAAKICGVAIRTVQKWLDSGKLKGFRVPASNHRRITRDTLGRFLRDNGMPLSRLDDGRHRVLIVSCDYPLIARMRELLPEDRDFVIESASGGFEAGYKLATFTPYVAILDLAIGRGEAISISGYLRPETVRIVLAGEDESESMERGFNHVLFRPFDVAVLANLIVKGKE